MDLWAFFQWNKLLFKNIVCPEKLKKKKILRKNATEILFIIIYSGKHD